MLHFLVTGGAGFIGSHLVETLVKQGHRVRVLDNFSTGDEANIREFLNDIELIEGDIRDQKTVDQAVSGVDYILHQAALGSVIRSVQDPMESHAVNVNGTLNLLIAAKEKGVKRFVFASSSSVYGNTPTLPKKENMRPQPISPYGASKLAAECYAISFYVVYKLPVVCLRYFNVFGPRQNAQSQYAAVIPKFIRAFMQNDRPIIHGDGKQTRDFTYVENVVNANLLACTSSLAPGHVFNIACGQRHSLLELFGHLKTIFQRDVSPMHTDPRPGDVRDSLAAIDLASEILGYRVNISFGEGLKKTVEAYVQDQSAIPSETAVS
ncbi:MAG: SDR family oxidoreductase [candidate division KSB1 bacterium]|nr:SDR family oxidoreductase [candidate division KSB1 bacterium]